MCTTSTIHREVEFGRVDWEILVVRHPESESVSHYRVTCSDRESGKFIGEAILPPSAEGGMPTLTLADIVELIGGYRLASVIVQIEAERLDRINRRCTDRARRRNRSWLRRVPASVLADHGLEAPAGGRAKS